MDTRMIDVGIGLVLVFALVGLAVSTLHELLISVSKARGRNLERAIASMLGEGKGGPFSAALLQHPLLVSLADTPLVGSGKPSYIGADVLVTALVTQLSQLYCAGTRPDTPQALVAAVRLGLGKLSPGTAEPGKDLVRVMEGLLSGTEADWNAYQKRLCTWYDAVAERSGGWFRRATQMRLFGVGLLLAALVNINPFVIAPRLWNDEALRKATVAAAERASASFQADVAASSPAGTQLRNALAALDAPGAARATAPSSIAQATLQAETDLHLAALSRALQSMTGAQKERGSVELLAQLQALVSQPEQLAGFITLQRAAGQAREAGGIDMARQSVRRQLMALAVALEELKAGAAARKELLARHAELVDAVAAETSHLLRERAPPAPHFCPPGGDETSRELCERMAQATQGMGLGGLPVGWVVANLPPCMNGPCADPQRAAAPAAGAPASAPTPAPAAADAPARLRTALALDLQAAPARTGGADSEVWRAMNLCRADASCAFFSVAGWVVTAFAAVLGAPFWFDLLGKLVKLRGSGAKPDDGAPPAGKAAPGGAPDGLLSTPASPAAAAAADTMRDVQTVAESRLTPQRVRELQSGTELLRFGARPSGFFDEAMRNAIQAWQSGIGEPATGELTQAQIERLLSPGSATPAAGAPEDVDEHHPDNCGCDTHSAVPDEALPKAEGGVSP